MSINGMEWDVPRRRGLNAVRTMGAMPEQDRATSVSPRRRHFWWWLPTFVLWPVVVYVWPGLRVDDSDRSRNWQSTADVTLATIVGTIVVLVLTVGLLALQMLSPYGWRATRMLVNRWFYAAAVVVVVAGVLLPVWVAANPSTFWTRTAFLCFGWSLLSIAASGAAVVVTISPQALVDSLVQRTTTVLARTPRWFRCRTRSLRAEVEALIEVFGSPALPDSSRKQVAGAIHEAMTKGPQADEFEFTDRLRSVITVAGNLSSPAQLMSSVDLIGGLGTANADSFGATQAAVSAISDIAASARAERRHELAKHALDSLAGLWISRLLAVLPANKAGAPERRTGDDVLTHGMEIVPPGHFYVIEDVTSTLRSRLSAPHPSSDQWPDGWQGTAAFEEDVRRIGRVATYLYSSGRYPGVEGADAVLADVAHHLVREGLPAVELRDDTTNGWWEKREHCHHPSVVVSEVLVDATTAAFDAGFDWQALHNARQLLSVMVAAMRHDDPLTATLYSSCLIRVAFLIGRKSGEAHRRRGDDVLAALIADTVTLWRTIGTDARLRHVAQEVVTGIAAGSLRFDEFLDVLSWHARLAAAGWPVGRASGGGHHDGAGMSALPASVVAEARGALLDHWSVRPLAVTLLMVLWTNAIVAESDSVTSELRNVVGVLQGWRERLPVHGGDDPIGRLCDSVRSWLDNGNTGERPAIRSAANVLSVRTLVQEVEKKQQGRSYHGVRVAGENGVLVVESDGSTRLLRHHDVGAVGVFGWGYEGTGPLQLAKALTQDCVGETLRCPTCLGSVRLALGRIACPCCSGTGHRYSPADIADALDDTLTSKLPGVPGCEPTRPGTEWSLPHDVLVEHVNRGVITD
jgi:hypothetical protein